MTYYWPHCRIIFLTGYSEFDYVHEALRKNVDNYILKTEGIDPIFQAVQEASSRLDEENRRRIQAEKAKVHFQMAEPLLKRELIQKVVKGEALGSLLSQPRYEEVEFGIDADRPAFLLVGRVGMAVEAKTKNAAQAVQMMFINDLPNSFTCEHAVLDDDLLVWLLQPGEELLDRYRRFEPDDVLHWQGMMSYMRAFWSRCKMNAKSCLAFRFLSGYRAIFCINGTRQESSLTLCGPCCTTGQRWDNRWSLPVSRRPRNTKRC